MAVSFLRKRDCEFMTFPRKDSEKYLLKLNRLIILIFSFRFLLVFSSSIAVEDNE